MTQYNPQWVSLDNKLFQANKSLKKTLSVLKKQVEFLAKDNRAWAQSYNNLLSTHLDSLALYNSLLESKLNDKDGEGTSAEK